VYRYTINDQIYWQWNKIDKAMKAAESDDEVEAPQPKKKGGSSRAGSDSSRSAKATKTSGKKGDKSDAKGTGEWCGALDELTNWRTTTENNRIQFLKEQKRIEKEEKKKREAEAARKRQQDDNQSEMSAATTIASDVGEEFVLKHTDWQDHGDKQGRQRDFKAHCPILTSLGCEKYDATSKIKELRFPRHEKAYRSMCEKLRTKDMHKIHETFRTGIIKEVTGIQCRNDAIMYRQTHFQDSIMRNDEFAMNADAKSEYQSQYTSMTFSPSKKGGKDPVA
jgi:hypothetical protein